MSRGAAARVAAGARATDPYGFRRALRALGWEPARLLVAESFLQRLVGMLALDPREGAKPTGAGPGTGPSARLSVVMAFPRCSSVHTCFMRSPIDVAFIDREGHVLSVCQGVPPWRIRTCRGAASVLERLSRWRIHVSSGARAIESRKG